MSNKPETSADIETELRELSESAKSVIAKYCEYQPTVYGKSIALYFVELADRIKAASKRELGNGAAMRAALTNLTRYGESDIRQLEQLAKRAIENDIYGGGILQALCGAIREGKSALSAPARNCDKYPIRKTAQIKFEESLPDIVKTEVRNYPFAAMDMFIDWLLANATEKACWAWEAQR